MPWATYRTLYVVTGDVGLGLPVDIYGLQLGARIAASGHPRERRRRPERIVLCRGPPSIAMEVIAPLFSTGR